MTTNPDSALISISKAGDYYPHPVDRKTVWRHIVHGITRDGTRATLKTTLSGGRRFTTAAWIREFHDAINAADRLSQGQPAMTPEQRHVQAVAARDLILAKSH